MRPAEIGKAPGAQQHSERWVVVDESKQEQPNITRELKVACENETALNCRATGQITMFAGCILAAVASVTHPTFCGDLVACMLMIVLTGIIVIMVTIIVIACPSAFGLRDMLMLPVLMQLARASMMETAPEYRVQQHCCDREKFARSGQETFS